MRVTVQLFAVARQRVGQSEVHLEVPDACTVGALRNALVRTHPELEPVVRSSRIAVDSEYAPDDRPVATGADVALIPPVSGG